jgi:hypothetical protein
MQYGDHSNAVATLQEILQSQGYFEHKITGQYLRQTKDAIVYFQQTHIDEAKEPLRVDGITGEKTLWAIKHPSGEDQRSYLEAEIPKNLSNERHALLEIALREHGAKESPDGSNWGDEIEKYGSITGSPWCCFFWSWCTVQRNGRFPMRAKFGRGKSAWYRAKALGMAHQREGYIPIPGDAFVMSETRDDRLIGIGHIGFVLRVEVKDGVAVRINTIEGNCGNRVKIGVRVLNNNDIVGFINCYPDDLQGDDWETGLAEVVDAPAMLL